MAQLDTPPIADRLAALRAEMKTAGLDFYLVPSSDAHQSEYLPECWQRRAYITGFTGSVGSAVIGHDTAWLWADSRYWLQADHELDPACYTLMRQGDSEVPSIPRFLARHAEGRVVGFDPMLHTPNEASALSDALVSAGARLVAVDNLIDRIWTTNRPPVPENPVTPWPAELSGRTLTDKLAHLRARLDDEGVDHLVVATLDELAWTFDLRGQDVDFNPVAIAWGLVSSDTARLFIAPSKLTGEALAHLAAANVAIAPYEAFGDALATVSGKVLVDKDNANRWILDRLEGNPEATVKLARSPVQLARAIKSEAEKHGMRQAHRRDAAAVVRFLAWLDDNFAGLDEISAADQLEDFRKENEYFKGLSFDTIAGFGPNGAIVHYRASDKTRLPIDDSTLFLLDSGAQYLDGTTDITRTLHLGTPTAAQREHYTRVLRGHLALGRATFPKGTTGTHLDALARLPLWEVGLNYGHGTGHGVGCYLSVHQGPHRVSPALNDVALEPGMVLSNEPGLYLTGEYGIRIENLVLVTERFPKSDAHPLGPYYGFEDLTVVPYCRKLIDASLLSPEERAQVDAYHARVRELVAPLLDVDEDSADATARAWLERETAPL